MMPECGERSPPALYKNEFAGLLGADALQGFNYKVYDLEAAL